MTAFLGYDLNSITINLTLMLASELILFLLFRMDNSGWKWQWSNTIISTWKPAAVIISLIIAMIILSPFLTEKLDETLNSFEYSLILVIPTSLLGFVWIWHFMIGKNANRQMGICILISIIFVGIFLAINHVAINDSMIEIIRLIFPGYGILSTE